MSAKRFAKVDFSAGSALILTVVLTSLLAIVGVLFVMMARVNQIASSGLSESKELDSAIETVIAKISDELVLDVPGVSATNPDYYDYPDVNNAWLASLEPYDKSGIGYCWRHISDVDGTLGNKANDLKAEIIDDYQNPSELEDSNTYSADADGDGVADSKWVELADITSSRGRPIYAAIRIIDNGGMLNVNTAYKFDPTDPNAQRIDGSSQMQINLAALSQRGANGSLATAADKLQARRCGAELIDLSLYEQNVVWRYGSPSGAYTLFDIGDELKLRNRYILNYNLMTSRIEELWTKVFDWGLDMPRNEKDHSIDDPNDWFWKANNSSSDTNEYDYRHISTAYNMDRIIDANGGKMLNINMVTAANDVYSTIREALTDYDPNFADVNKVAAQIAVNLRDFRDNDSNVTSINVDGSMYYGFERPCIYISELAHKFAPPIPPDVNPYRSYAVELYKPYFGDNDPCDWRLVIGGTTTIDINNWTGNEQFYVIRDQNSNAPLDVNLGTTVQNATFAFTVNTEIRLERPLPGGGDVTVDWYEVDPCIPAPWLSEDNAPHSVHRDIQPHKCIRRLWAMDANSPTLGRQNNFVHPDANGMQAHPANKAFTNVGEIGMVFRRSAYSEGPNTIGPTDTEADVRINFAESEFQQIFNCLTVFDPAVYPWNDPNETRVKGRININTAPWYVIAQLPWVSQREGGYSNTALAETIVAYRDKTAAPGGDPDYSTRLGAAGFESIGQLCDVNDGGNPNFGIDYYKRIVGDQAGFPDLDLPSPDGAEDDFEERDVIFARISNLVTVRSDVFTAYILVRVGTDGPQKRVIAILDRSNVYSPTDRVKIVAVHPVADPR